MWARAQSMMQMLPFTLVVFCKFASSHLGDTCSPIFCTPKCDFWFFIQCIGGHNTVPNMARCTVVQNTRQTEVTTCHHTSTSSWNSPLALCLSVLVIVTPERGWRYGWIQSLPFRAFWAGRSCNQCKPKVQTQPTSGLIFLLFFFFLHA